MDSIRSKFRNKVRCERESSKWGNARSEEETQGLRENMPATPRSSCRIVIVDHGRGNSLPALLAGGIGLASAAATRIGMPEARREKKEKRRAKFEKK